MARIVSAFPAAPWLLVVLPLALAVGAATLFAPAGLVLFAAGAMLLTIAAFAGFRAAAWQAFTFVSLLGFIVLNYGFANWSMRAGGLPIPVGHVTAAAALALSLAGHGRDLKAFLRTPIAKAWALMAVLAIGHLVVDLPRYGAYAARDSSFVLEGAFLALGWMYARGSHESRLLLRMMAVLFVVNLLYALTFPLQHAIRALSPVSGVFISVPLFGFYANTSLYLLSGALFSLLLGRRATGWSTATIVVLAAAQVGWSLVLQVRSMYLGMALSAVVMVLLGGVRSGGARNTVILFAAAALFLFVADFFELELRGRVGEVSREFFLSHLRSLLMRPDTPGLETVQWRLDLLPSLWNRWTGSVANVLLGEGFGEPLIDHIGWAGVATRAPHNTHVTVIMRLGLAGLALWTFVHARILALLVRRVRREKRDSHLRDLYLWLLLFYLLGMLFTSVEPWLEFSFGAVPFYILIGFAMGLSEAEASRPPLESEGKA